MEIRQHSASRAESETRIDKEVRVTSHLCKASAQHCRLNRSNAGRANTDHALCLRQASRIRRFHLEVFFVQLDLLDLVLAQWSERSQPYVQSDSRDLRAGFAAGLQQGLGEMETRRRSSRRARFLGKDRLIPLAVSLIRLAMYVWR